MKDPGDLDMTLVVVFRSGEPCKHPGCLSHISHCCEGCGRIAGRGDVKMSKYLYDQWLAGERFMETK